jgi:threonine dehydratase
MEATLSPVLPQRADLRAAQKRIAPFLRRTPLLELRVPTPWGPRPVLAKLELLQVTGCFKVRGALAAISATEAPEVVACSGGNHGLGVAHAAQVLGRRAIIFLPEDAAQTKVEGMRARGAELRFLDGGLEAAFLAAARYAEAQGLPLIHPYDQAEVIAGQGTLGLELRSQAPQVERWLAAVGGGGLAAGLLLGLGDRAELVPVEPERCPSLYRAQQGGGPAFVPSSGAARSSLGAPSLGRLPWEILKERLGPVARVSEAAILEAQRWLWTEARLVAEPGGATALAALMSGAWRAPDAGPLGLVLCGGNADGLP